MLHWSCPPSTSLCQHPRKLSPCPAAGTSIPIPTSISDFLPTGCKLALHSNHSCQAKVQFLVTMEQEHSFSLSSSLLPNPSRHPHFQQKTGFLQVSQHIIPQLPSRPITPPSTAWPISHKGRSHLLIKKSVPKIRHEDQWDTRHTDTPSYTQ